MRLLIVRHGDPDYEADSLTEKGWREAELLSERMAELTVKAFYVSPLGRARDTASLTLKKMGRRAVECDWLREFPPQICRPDVRDGKSIVWDWLPEDWMADERYFDRRQWCETEIMREARVEEMYRYVTDSFDSLLAEHGYVRQGGLYRAERPNRDTIVFFCHFGVECVLLSHLLGISPMPLWHGTCVAPSGVTSVYTEERRPGRAAFRINFLGDTSHLYAAGEEPAFAARFCETYDNAEERHD